ncbi:hypothetical protein R3W88_021378 [Solanum pinnatisectum]|uniref:Uncharacterized protein n=1 Tax=Solanum pinnatisectum TaxID=50273 RepID=A0AAV9LV68_9SOLN|nr:hypothetical protein R3W88_021378 [Solanum pinnatisectum]
MFRASIPLHQKVCLHPLSRSQSNLNLRMENPNFSATPQPPPQTPLLFATQPVHPLHQPMSWVEMALQGHAPIFSMDINDNKLEPFVLPVATNASDPGTPYHDPNSVPMDIPPPPPLGENEGSVIPVLSGSFTEISSLRNSALMLFPEKEDKKYILNYPVAPKKCSFDLRPPLNTALAKYAVVMTPTIYRSRFLNKENQGSYTPTMSGLLMNQPSVFIVWNTMGANSDDFKRNFKELIRSHSPCMVALLETKMENHINLKGEFGFDDYYEVPAQGRSGGIVLF